MASRVSGENSVRHTSVATARLAYWHCRSASDVRWSSRRREGCSSGLIAALAYLTAGRSPVPLAPGGAGPPPPARGPPPPEPLGDDAAQSRGLPARRPRRPLPPARAG